MAKYKSLLAHRKDLLVKTVAEGSDYHAITNCANSVAEAEGRLVTHWRLVTIHENIMNRAGTNTPAGFAAANIDWLKAVGMLLVEFPRDDSSGRTNDATRCFNDGVRYVLRAALEGSWASTDGE